MRLVTGSASGVAGVVFSHDLREFGGFGRIRLMALDAQHGGIGELGIERLGIFGVFSQRSVASLATDTRVRAGFLKVCDIRVARFASFPSCEAGGASGDVVEGSGAVVAVLAEAFGDYQTPRNEENDKSGDENQSDADQMLGVPESIAHCVWHGAGNRRTK